MNKQLTLLKEYLEDANKLTQPVTMGTPLTATPLTQFTAAATRVPTPMPAPLVIRSVVRRQLNFPHPVTHMPQTGAYNPNANYNPLYPSFLHYV